MEIDNVMYCTVRILELLIKLYNSNKISYDDFIKQSQLKIIFLENNLDNFTYTFEKEQATKTIKLYKYIQSEKQKK